MKERQIKIFGFDRDSILDREISSENLESKVVTLPDCFFVHAYECYSGKSLSDGDFLNGIIKEFENLISLGKFEEIEISEEEACINKDILSRISLGLTSAQPVGDMPEIKNLWERCRKRRLDY